MTTAIDALAGALYGFLARAPQVRVSIPHRDSVRLRPMREDDLEILHFRQEWSNTLMMFSAPDMIAGQGFTKGYTTVLTHGNRSHLFCNGHHAYSADADCGNLLDDLRDMAAADVGAAPARYEGYQSA